MFRSLADCRAPFRKVEVEVAATRNLRNREEIQRSRARSQERGRGYKAEFGGGVLVAIGRGNETALVIIFVNYTRH